MPFYSSSPSFPIEKSVVRIAGSPEPLKNYYGQVDSYAKQQINFLNLIFSVKCIEIKRNPKNEVKFEVGAFDVYELQLDELIEALIKETADRYYMTVEKVIEEAYQNPDQLMNKIRTQDAQDGNLLSSVAELAEKAGKADLLHQVRKLIDENRFSGSLSFNANKLLSEKPILEYSFCRAVYHKDLKLLDSTAIYSHISNDKEGAVKLFYDWIVIQTAIKIKLYKKYQIDDDLFDEIICPKLKDKNFSFEENIFSSNVTSIIEELIYGEEQYKLIDEDLREKLNIRDEDIPALVNYIKQSKVTIDADNAPYFLSIALNHIRNVNISYMQISETGKIDSNFSVDLFEDDYSILDFDPKNIECAAQLWYSMVYLDEAEISNAVDTIITKYLLTGKINIKSRETIRDIQLYALNRRFREINTGMEYERTQPDERRMYYMQVFNAGGGEANEGTAYNPDFPILWENLLTATAKFIEQAALNDYPGQNLPRTKIIQAVEALGSNLSTHCSGMVKAASPYISGELSFDVRKILLNEEIREQIAPGNNGFLKVLTNVLKELRGEAPNLHALGNRARYGYEIISNIAQYTPGYLDDDKNFNKMVGAIEGFIIANSQLENIGIPGLENIEGEEKAAAAIGNKSNEWNF